MATTHGVWVGGSCPEIASDAPADDQRPSNVFVLVAPDGTEHRYRKIHPFSHADEERYVRAGTQFVTVDIDGLRCSLFVCYDLRFADEFWAAGARRATPTSSSRTGRPSDASTGRRCCGPGRSRTRRTWSVCNRVGSGGGLDYSGDSAIIDPLGEVLATGAGGETILLADLDPAHVATTRDHFRFLQDRR